MSSANTSLGFGHGTCVDMRTCMYETRKHEKMNVSLSRKIHIIALPHGTGKACLSPAKSVTTPDRPSAALVSCIELVMTSTAIGVGAPRVQVASSRQNSTSQTASRKCQYTVQSSTVTRVRPIAAL